VPIELAERGGDVIADQGVIFGVGYTSVDLTKQGKEGRGGSGVDSAHAFWVSKSFGGGSEGHWDRGSLRGHVGFPSWRVLNRTRREDRVRQGKEHNVRRLRE
jgi:hypothetical protein